MQGPDEDDLPLGMHNLLRNKNGGSYICGQSYSLVTKIRVGDAICKAKSLGNYVKKHVAKECGVSNKYVTKVEAELIEHRRVLSPKEVKQLQHNAQVELGTVGVGCQTIDSHDRYVLYALYLEQPYQSLHSYQDWLCYFTGSNPSKTTIRRQCCVSHGEGESGIRRLTLGESRHHAHLFATKIARMEPD
jgi:hypothetical protein